MKVDNIAQIAAAGADTFVAGSAVFGAPCDTDPNHFDATGAGPNCSDWRQVTVPPVLSATRGTGRTFAVRLDDRRYGVADFSCRVSGGGQDFTIPSDGSPHEITIDDTVPAGSQELSCSYRGLKQSVTVSVP